MTAGDPEDARVPRRHACALAPRTIVVFLQLVRAIEVRRIGRGVHPRADAIAVDRRTAVEVAENWGTYVTVHAYTPRAVRQAIEAGVKCIDHGQLLDEATVKLMAENGVWWSMQPFTDVLKMATAKDRRFNRASLIVGGVG